MLGRASYSPAYIKAVHDRVTRVLKAFDKAKPAEPFASEALIDMVLGLEVAFVHRLRMQEGKDGNVLNEVPGFFHVGELHFLWKNAAGRGANNRCGCGRPVRL